MLELQYIICDADSLVRIRETQWPSDEFQIMTRRDFDEFVRVCYPFHVTFTNITDD